MREYLLLALVVLMGARSCRAEAVPLPAVGGRIDVLLTQPQDPYACGDAVLEAAEALRARGGGAFDLPVNCPRLALRWPYTARRTGSDTFIVNTLEDAVVVRLPGVPTPPAPRRRKLLTAGTPVTIIDARRTHP